MPQVTVTSSVLVKEDQSDVKAAAEVEVSFKDNAVDDYNGPIRLALVKEASRVINTDHLTNLRVLIFKRLSGGTWRLSLRKSTSETTDLIVGRFFAAELTNVEHIKITALSADVEIQVELVGINQA